MSADDEKNAPGFVVKDRRRFDSDGNEKGGNEKSGNEKSGHDKAAAAPQPKSAASKVEASEMADDEMPEINFGSFIMSLATQALMQLGELKPPPGMGIEVNKVAAKQTIDILSMLQEKTKSGLQPDEAQLLEDILHNLRLSFVKTGK